jgi:hypothetical protein
VVAISVRTIIRNTDWVDNTTLAIATARDNPRSAKACYWAGTILGMSTDRKWSDVGEMLFKRSVEQYPTFSLSYWELAKLYGRRNELAKSALYLSAAAEFSSGDPELRAAIRGIQADFRMIPAEKYKADLDRQIQERPGAAAYFARALAELAQSKNEDAKNDLRDALLKNVSFHEAAYQLALLQLKTPGLEEQGIHTMKMYLKNVTGSYEAYCSVAESLLALDPVRFPAALDDAEHYVGEARALAQEHPGLRQLQDKLRDRRAQQAAHRGEERERAHHDVTAGVTP